MRFFYSLISSEYLKEILTTKKSFYIDRQLTFIEVKVVAYVKKNPSSKH